MSQEVYTITVTFQPDRNHRLFELDDQDQTEVIGVFSTLELANSAAEAYVKERIEPFLQSEVDEEHPDKDHYIETSPQTYGSGCKKWWVYPKLRNYIVTVETERWTVRTSVWERKDMPLPLHGYLAHSNECPCCEGEEDPHA